MRYNSVSILFYLGLNSIPKYVFLIYGNEVKLYFVHVIDHLSAFLELCNKCEVISSDSCNSVRVLKSRIAHADSVLIISSADTVRRYRASPERSDLCEVPKTTPVGDSFESAIKIIKRNFQSEVTYVKFRQIILPCCQDGSEEVGLGLLDLKVKKTYLLMEFIQEMWENKMIPGIWESNADDFMKCCETFKKLEQAVSSTNCCLKQCCRNKTCPQNSERHLYEERSYDSGIGDSYRSSYSPDETPLSQSYLLSTTQCTLLEFRKKEILDNYVFFKSRNSSSETISLSAFNSKAVTFNYDFDRDLQADEIDNECIARIYLQAAES